MAEEKKPALKPLDATDRTILNHLQRNAKLTHKEIAAALGLTVTPIYERIKRLERQGYIKGYHARVSKEHMTLQVQAFANVSLQEHQTEQLRRFEREVIKLPEVVACYHVAGQFDYLLHIMVRDMPAYQEFVTNRLAGLSHIRQVQSSFVMTEVKEYQGLPISVK